MRTIFGTVLLWAVMGVLLTASQGQFTTPSITPTAAPTPPRPIEIGCFSFSRSLYSFCDSPAFDEARALIDIYFMPTYVRIDTIPSDLRFIPEVLIIDSSFPLSIEEQNALLAYVEKGGSALVFAVQIFTTSFDAANSILFPFGLFTEEIDTSGAVQSYNITRFPNSTLITDGTYGTVIEFHNKLESMMMVPLEESGNTFELMGVNPLTLTPSGTSSTEASTLIHIPPGSRGFGQALVLGHFLAFADTTFFPPGLIHVNKELLLNFLGATLEHRLFPSFTPTPSVSITPSLSPIATQGAASHPTPTPTPLIGAKCAPDSPHLPLDYQHCSAMCTTRTRCFICCQMWLDVPVFEQLCRESCVQEIDGVIIDDPHFTGFHGEKYDFQGHDNEVFNLITDPNLQLNALFYTPKDMKDATYISRVGLKTTFGHRLVLDKARNELIDVSRNERLSFGYRYHLLANNRLTRTKCSMERPCDGNHTIELYARRYHLRVQLMHNPPHLNFVHADFIAENSKPVPVVRLQDVQRHRHGTLLSSNARTAVHEAADHNDLEVRSHEPHGILGQTAVSHERRKGTVMRGSNWEGSGVVEGHFRDYQVAGKDLFGDGFKFNRFGLQDAV